MIIRGEDLLQAANALTSYWSIAGAGRSIKIGQGVSCLAEKLNIKGTIDNKGQNENFFNGKSKNEVES